MLATLEIADVAVGSRYVAGGGTRNWGMFRRLLSRGGSLYARTILRTPIRDFTGGFNGWHRRVLEKIELDRLQTQGYAFQIELKYRAWQHGFAIREFPIVFEDRRVGQSKMSKKIVFEALGRVWQLRFSGRSAG
jgi:dolichol-phosphate mannosyltransferase